MEKRDLNTYAKVMSISLANWSWYQYLAIKRMEGSLEDGSQDQRDFNRLSKWWNNLGEINQDKIKIWAKELSRETEDKRSESIIQRA